MTDAILLQSFVPRYESIRYKIGNRSWKNGFQNIFLYGVPFSGRSNGVIALRHARLIHCLLRESGRSSDTVHLLELGAGHGILSKHILDALNQHYPDIYERVQLTLSDYSAEVLQVLAQSRFLAPHRDKLSFLRLIEDISGPLYGQRFDYVFSAYLYDTFPCRHIELGKRVSEYLVKTALPAGLTLFDTRVFPPEKITASELADLCKTSPDVFADEFGPKIAPYLAETFEKVPVEETMPAEGVAFLTEFKHYSGYSGLLLNVSFEAITHIRTVIGYLKEHGAYLFSDVFVGPNAPATAASLTRAARFISYFPVTMDCLAFQYHSLHGITIQRYPKENVVDCLITKEQTSSLAKEFKRRFATSGTEPVRVMITRIHETESRTVPLTELWPESIEPEYRSDYFLLQSLLHFFLTQQRYDDAKTVAEEMLTHYQELAVDAFRALAFPEIKKKRRQSLAEQYLKQVLTLCPQDSAAYHLLGNYYCLKKQYSLAKEAYLSALRFYPDTVLNGNRECLSDFWQLLDVLMWIHDLTGECKVVPAI